MEIGVRYIYSIPGHIVLLGGIVAAFKEVATDGHTCLQLEIRHVPADDLHRNLVGNAPAIFGAERLCLQKLLPVFAVQTAASR